MNEQHKQLLLKTATVIRQLKAERDWLVNELATKMHKESASKFANELVQRGICTREELDQMVEKISKIGNLGAVKQAVDIVQPRKDLPIGQVEKTASEMGSMSAAERKMLEDPAIQFLMGCV